MTLNLEILRIYYWVVRMILISTGSYNTDILSDANKVELAWNIFYS